MATAPHEVQDVDVDGDDDGDDGDGDVNVFLSPEVYWSMRGAHRTTGFLPFPSLLFPSHFLSSSYLPQIRRCHPVTTIYPSISFSTHSNRTAHSDHSSSHKSAGHTAHTAHTAQLHLWPCGFGTHSILAPIHTCHCDLIVLQAAAELSCMSLLLSLAHNPIDKLAHSLGTLTRSRGPHCSGARACAFVPCAIANTGPLLLPYAISCLRGRSCTCAVRCTTIPNALNVAHVCSFTV